MPNLACDVNVWTYSIISSPLGYTTNHKQPRNDEPPEASNMRMQALALHAYLQALALAHLK